MVIKTVQVVKYDGKCAAVVVIDKTFDIFQNESLWTFRF